MLEALGSGGMGQVYLAEDPRLGRRIALKVLSPETASQSEKLARFEREAKAVAQLSHPGIVMLHSIEEADGLRFLTMEHVEGETLSKAIPPRGFVTERLLSLAIGLTDAVAAAHRQGILHRDLKPENVMLTPDGRLKVLDFGLAKLRDDGYMGDRTLRETQSVTQDGRIVGTVAYMSPEQAQGLPVDNRSDIFTLGILLYEMATGERPFRGGTNLSVLSSILKDTPRPVSELRDDVPRPLARMIERALEKRPEDRYQSATDLRRDLEDLKRDVDTGDLVLRTTAGRRRLVAQGGGRRWALPVAAGASLLVLAGMAGVFLHGQPPAAAEDGRHSLAVLYFENVTGDPSVDWLRTGLTDMLVTNLSQSPDLRVLSTQRLYQILDETGHRDDRSLSGQVVATVARQAQATTALVGSFVRAGERIRIQASLQDPRTGEVIASERVEGDPERGAVRAGGRPHRPAAQAARDAVLREVRREEGEEAPGGDDRLARGLQGLRRGQQAPRAYAGARRQGVLREGGRGRPRLRDGARQASVVNANLGDTDKAREYAAKAVAKSESLPPGERYYIEGRHYSLDPRSTEKAVAAYQKAVDSAPDHTAARNNLAQALIGLHRYPEALVHLEELRRRGMSFPGSYMSLAETYLATGQPDKAREALTAYIAAGTRRAARRLENLGFFELMQGRTDEALAAFDKAASLGPSDVTKLEMGRAMAHGLREEWPQAEGCARRLMSSEDPRERWEGGATLAIASLYRGDAGAARRLSAEGAHERRERQRAHRGPPLPRAARVGPRAPRRGARRGGPRRGRGGSGAQAARGGPRHARALARAPRARQGGRAAARPRSRRSSRRCRK